MDREGIEVVVELVRDAITSPTNQNNPITPELKCSATLWYLATGENAALHTGLVLPGDLK